MIKHIVMWKFKEGNEQKISEFLKGLEGLVGQIDVIRSLKTLSRILLWKEHVLITSSSRKIIFL